MEKHIHKICTSIIIILSFVLVLSLQISQTIYGKDVRENIASGIEDRNIEVISTKGKQNVLGSQFNDLVINAGSSNSEGITAKNSVITGKTFGTIGHRIDDNLLQSAKSAHMRIVLATDVHYDSNLNFDTTKEEKADLLIKCLNNENKNRPIDMVFILGDISSTPSTNPPLSYTWWHDFVDNYLPQTRNALLRH